MKPAPRHCTLWSPTHHCHSFIPITFLPSYRHHRHCTLELPTCHPFMPAIIAIVFFSQLTPSMTPRSQDQLLSHLDPLPGYLVQATTLVRQIFALHNHWTYYLETYYKRSFCSKSRRLRQLIPTRLQFHRRSANSRNAQIISESRFRTGLGWEICEAWFKSWIYF